MSKAKTTRISDTAVQIDFVTDDGKPVSLIMPSDVKKCPHCGKRVDEK